MRSYKYKKLLEWIHEGKSPEEIIDLMPMRPSLWRRLLGGKWFQRELQMRQDLAAAMTVHKIASGVHEAAEQFTHLADCDKPETVRKVCLALLHEGLQCYDHGAGSADSQDAPVDSPQSKPWTMLRPLDGSEVHDAYPRQSCPE